MPIAVALSLLVQVTCAYHVVKTGRDKYWLFIILFFSLIGCAIYFFVEMLPDLMGGRTGRNLAAGAKKIIDPDRVYREAMTQVEISPTAHNKRVLAEACVARGNYAEAIALYTETLTGHDAHEPDLLRSRAGARLLAGDHAGALADLDALRAHNPDYQSEEAHLIYARPGRWRTRRGRGRRIRSSGRLFDWRRGTLPLRAAAERVACGLVMKGGGSPPCHDSFPLSC